MPNVYQGLYYVRVTRETNNFMRTADKVFNTWDDEIKKLRMFDKFEPSTDFAFSIALDKCNMNNCFTASQRRNAGRQPTHQIRVCQLLCLFAQVTSKWFFR